MERELQYLSVLEIGFDFTTHVEATAYFARQGERKKRDRGLVPEVSFFAFNMDVSSELEESISAALEGDLDLSVERSFISVNGVGCGIKERFDEELASRLGRSSARQKAFYGETFENPSLYFGSTSYSGPDKVGVLVRAPVIRIPTGDGGEISGNLFAYARKYFMGPLSIAVPKADLKE
jgi:hypothetical protein